MNSAVIGTAGHIDHGKTALVKALTGIDADRLAEEKRRGITIDLGFAHLLLKSDGAVATNDAEAALRLSFVDVPGHERFVRNMLAGVGGMDVVMLVVAADEGIMPQTREHFEICRLLQVPRGITVLTKADSVDEETLAVLRMEVEEFVRGSFLDTAHAALLAVSAKSGEGIAELRSALAKLAVESGAREADELTRLPIDRVFTMKGFGTVVTGTLISGSIRKEDELELFPAGRKVRVRGIQVHGGTVSRARAGERVALNLTGVEKDELARGMMLASAGTLRAAKQFYVKLETLASAKPLRSGARVHLHAFSAESIAEVQLLEGKQLAADGTGYARLKLAEPQLLLPHDRFIIRQFSPVVTMGGGVVLDAVFSARAARTKPKPEQLVALLSDAALVERVNRRGRAGIALRELAAEMGAPVSKLSEELQRASAAAGEVRRVGAFVISAAGWAELKNALIAELEAFHKREPLATGMNGHELLTRLSSGLELHEAALAELLREKKVETAGDLVRLVGRGAQLDEGEAASKQIIESAFETAGLKVPALKEVLAGLPLDRVRGQKLVTLLLREKKLVKVAEDMVVHANAIARLRALLAEQKARSPKLDVATFKELTGVSRKYAIPLLEHLDRERVTRREGEARLIL